MTVVRPFQILYHAGPCLVVCKSAGILTQSPRGIDSLEIQVKEYFKQLENKTGQVYLGVPHRLDRPVSGAVVLARHVRAARRLSEQFAGRTVRKVYWALVEGVPDEPAGTWRDFLWKVPDKAHVQVVDESHENSREAILHYRILGRFESETLLEIELETGRTHQVRVQVAHRGLPIRGDAQYGASQTFGPPCRDPRQRAIGLHARRLEFHHPMTREPVSVSAPLAADWDEWVSNV